MARGWFTGVLLAAALLGAGSAQAAPDARAIPPGRVLHISVTLNPRNPTALAAYARAVSTPGSPDYRRFLTPAQFSARFGPTPRQMAAVRRMLTARGLRPGPARALSIPVTATARALERAFAVSARALALPGRQTAIVDSVRAAASPGTGSAIQSIVGLGAGPGLRPLLVRSRARAASGTGSSPAPRRGFARPRAAGAAPSPCPAAQAATAGTVGQGAHTTDQIASAYGFPGLYGAGDEGQGVTVAVYELEPNAPSDIAAYQACYGTHALVHYVPVDGGGGAGPGSGEAALDIENLIGMAPDANVLVYQGPNSESGAPGSGPYDTFSAIISEDRAQVITVSWGQCERAIGWGAANAENTLFAQAAVQGQTIVAADGDSGAQDCNSPGGVTQTAPAVDDPSSQPFVTGVGGTSLTALGPRPTESVWNSGTAVLPGDQQPGASGGGVSGFWPMPAAQFDAAPGLGVLTPAAAGPACGQSSGYCREVPDVSADADPATGYLFYWNGNGEVPGQPQGWQGIGGTSAAAPVWAALMTLADAYPGCAGAPVGYAGPALYRAAGSDYAAAFNDVTTGNNDFTGTNGGHYAATPGYDPATGLGTPNATGLVPALCDNTLRVTPVAAQRTAVHAWTSLRIRALDAPGAGVRFQIVASHPLPPGVRLNPATGMITGRASRTGRYDVIVKVLDADAATASAAFTWIVGGAPRVSHVTFAGSIPQLAFTVNAGAFAPALRTIVVNVPRGLQLVTARGASVHTTARHPAAVRFHSRLTRGALTISLRSATAAVRIILSAPALRAAGGPLPNSSRAGRLALTVTDASAGVTRLNARVR